MKSVRLIWLSADTVQAYRAKAEALCEPEDIRKAACFVKEEDQLLSLGGSYLIRRFVGPSALIYKGPKGKPLSDHIYFNLSHSADRIALALADEPVGLDLEKEPLEKTEFEEELRAFCLSEEEQASGRSLWELFVSKEALVKAIGSGLPDDIPQVPALPLNGELFWEGQHVYRKQLKRGQYLVSLCLINHDFTIQEETVDAI